MRSGKTLMRMLTRNDTDEKNFIDNKFIAADGKASQLSKKLSKTHQLVHETPSVMTNKSAIN